MSHSAASHLGLNYLSLIYFEFPVKTRILTLCRPIDHSIKFDTDKSGWSIVNIEESQVKNSK